MTDDEMALDYYRSAFRDERPGYVPARVRVPFRVRGDDPFRMTFVTSGDYDCACNQWGAVAVRTASGEWLGLKPSEFEVLAWRANEAGAKDDRGEG